MRDRTPTPLQARIVPLCVGIALVAVVIAVLLHAPTAVTVACAIIPSALGPLIYQFLRPRSR
jgi:lipopolysaccharide/colanic/teichoic acid biosynthesis glycosyltransferase